MTIAPDRLGRGIDLTAGGASGTLPDLFRSRAEHGGSDVAYQQYDPAQGVWLDFTWHDMATLVRRWRRALQREGLAAGDRVAILLRNSVEWVCFDQAALSLGLVVVPLFTTDAPASTAYVLANSGTRLLLIDSHERWLCLAAHCASMTDLERVVCLRGCEDPGGDSERPRDAGRWLATAPDAGADPEAHITPGTLATIVYTSGTTGRPKGVMLSHRNLLSAAETILVRNPGTRDDVFLSYLPLAHIFERVVGCYVPMVLGARVVFARSVEQLPQDLLVARPTILLLVPRLLDRVYATVQARMKRSRLIRLLIERTVAIGLARYAAIRDGASLSSLPQRAAWPLLRRLVARRVLDHFGGRVRLAVSGGAPLSGEVGRFFLGLGLPLIEGYGLTEVSSAVCAAKLGTYVPGSVGEPFDGTELRIAGRDEILVRSPGVMLGYWNSPENTADAIDAEGWLHTGDIGEIRDGRLFIRGRLKEIIVLSTGKKVSPTDIEAAITKDPLFSQAMVIGDGHPHLGALLVLDGAAWGELARALGLDPEAPASLSAPAVQEALLPRIRKLLSDFPPHVRINAVHPLLEPWTIEGGMLTPTMKLKRGPLQQRFQEETQTLFVSSTNIR
jgi:long-chain acyl-CoA synthetase